MLLPGTPESPIILRRLRMRDELKVLVTGGAGFIGTHLTECLLTRGHAVSVLDHNRPRLVEAEWVKGDLISSLDCVRASRGIDAVVHLAARIQRPMRGGEAEGLVDPDLDGTRQILSAVSRSGVRSFMFASSAAVYGNTTAEGVDEDSPCSPNNAYGISKHKAEGRVLAHKVGHPDTAISIIRVFNTFGEWQIPYRPGSVVANFVDRSLKCENLNIRRDGSQIRDFLYAKDIALAIALILENEVEGIYNIASGQPRTIKEVAQMVIQKVGSGTLRFSHGSIGDEGVACSVGDSSKLSRATGWQPRYKFEDALDRVVEWYRSQ